MIARLRGILAAIGDDHAIIDVAGVGYLVTVAPATLERLPRVGEAVELHTELHSREDGITLYGFPDAADRTWFRLLQTVQGVGARVALSLLGRCARPRWPTPLPPGTRRCWRAPVGSARGWRPGSSSELKERVGACRRRAAASRWRSPLAVPSGDALSALIHLGYARAEAYAAVARVQARLGTSLAVDALVREGLKELTA